jgi:NADPH2:quinone reductase
MRAAVYVRRGAAADVLSIVSREIPTPAEGEVRVRIFVSAVNPSDTKARGTWRGTQMVYPEVVPHQDGAGIIDAVGSGVDKNRIGERVWLFMAQRGRPNGTAADYCIVPEDRVVRLPAETSFAEGACLGIPAMTAHYALQPEGQMAGRAILVHGGAGAVGFYAIQLAKLRGAHVIATVSREEQAKQARIAGADEIINRREPDLAGAILAIRPEGVDRILDVDFAANQAVDLAVIRPGGTIAAFASDSNIAPTFEFASFMQKNAMIHAVLIYEAPRSALESAVQDITKLLQQKRLHHQIGLRLPLERIVEAHLAQEGRDVIGKILLDLAE